jgi:hypothetical protein
MDEYIISMFIDDELDLDEKIEFVEKVHESAEFKDETIAFLTQEKELRTEPVEHDADITVPLPDLPTRKRHNIFNPLGIATAALAAAVVIMTFVLLLQQQISPAQYRFVLYQPDVAKAEIAGTFTDWQRLPMNELGTSGYWEIQLDLPKGEHRFSYILEGDKRIADPTVLTREFDDFGGENSILYVGNSI